MTRLTKRFNPPSTLMMATVVFSCLAAVIIAQMPAAGQAPPEQAEKETVPLPTDPATIVAVVGQTPILWGDIEQKVNSNINAVLKKLGQQFPEEELTLARTHLARQAIGQSIRFKMMREAFLLDQVATQAAEKRDEVAAMMESRSRQLFFESEVAALKEKYKIEDLTKLDEKLRSEGSSLRARQREFSDMMLGHMYMKSKVNQDPKVTIAEINSRYRRDAKEYRRGASARWEQLSVLFEKHPDADEAKKLIADMGREAFFGGSMEAVAKARSEEPYASEGGLHPWTTQGALASKPIDEQLFSIPLNRMSEIIEDDRGLHIIRVLERRPAGTQPLAELQDKIREEIKQEKMTAAQDEMVRAMQQRVPVWSMFPDDFPGAKPLRATNTVRVAEAPKTEQTR